MMKRKKIIVSLLLIGMMLMETVGCSSTSASASATVENRQGGSELQRVERTTVESSTQEVHFAVEESGEYSFRTEYILNGYNSTQIEISVTIDGQPAYTDANLSLPIYWKMDGDVKQDANGNDVRPSMEAAGVWMLYTALADNDCVVERPTYSLAAGEHTAVFTFDGADVQLRNTEFYVVDELPDYETYLENHQGVSKYEGNAIVIDAEKFWLASSRFIMPANENGNPCTTPSDPYALRLNTVGGTGWQKSGEEIVWNLEDVITEEGLYYISARFMQNYSSGLEVYRTLTVNGEIPFQEATVLTFPYDEEWQSEELGYYFYLKPGDKLALRTTIGESDEVSDIISETIALLNDLYSQITVITGTTPDIYFDYDIVGQIPDFSSQAEACAEKLTTLTELLERKYDATEAGFTSLYGAKRLLETVAEKPRLITQSGNLGKLKSYMSEMGTLITNIQNQPLLLDSISFMSEKTQLRKANPGFFQDLSYRIRRIISSYTRDYNMVSGEQTQESIKVWVNTGRDQASIINEMILQDFTPHTGIQVELELVQTSLISANFAGTAPDLVLQSAQSEVVNFAMRNALEDISEYEGFAELQADYAADAFVPFTYEDGCYGIPETMSFSMMFYRKDLFEEMGITPPTTWEQVVNETLPALSWYGKEFGVGAIGAGSTLFTNLLYQGGGKMYSDDYQTTALNTEEAYEAIQFGTQLYTEYDVPQSYDAMNRFRSGEMPAMIESYAFYNNLSYTCPELNGLWEMVAIPGIIQEDGEINNCQASDLTGCFMFKSSENKEAAWEFMKWWTGADRQVEFGIKQEMVLGAAGRYTPANLDALQQLPWTSAQLEKINEQIDTLFCLPQVPGNYYLTRCINNAFQTTVISGENAREQLIIWNAQINMELERKREEFNYQPAFDNGDKS